MLYECHRTGFINSMPSSQSILLLLPSTILVNIALRLAPQDIAALLATCDSLSSRLRACNVLWRSLLLSLNYNGPPLLVCACCNYLQITPATLSGDVYAAAARIKNNIFIPAAPQYPMAALNRRLYRLIYITDRNWRLGLGKSRMTARREQLHVAQLDLSCTLATCIARSQNSLALWNYFTGFVHYFNLPNGMSVSIVSASSSAHLVLTTECNRLLVFPKTSNFRIRATLESPTAFGRIVQLHNDDLTVAVGFENGAIVTWCLKTLRLILSLPPPSLHPDCVTCLLVDTKRDVLVAGYMSGLFSYFRLSSATVIHQMDIYNAAPACICISEHFVASGTTSGAIMLWLRDNIEHNVTPSVRSAGVRPRTLLGHTGLVSCIYCDDRKLVSSSADRTLRVWDVKRGCIMYKLSNMHRAPLVYLTFNHWRLAAADDEGRVYEYEFMPDALDMRDTSALPCCPKRRRQILRAEKASVYADADSDSDSDTQLYIYTPPTLAPMPKADRP